MPDITTTAKTNLESIASEAEGMLRLSCDFDNTILDTTILIEKGDLQIKTHEFISKIVESIFRATMPPIPTDITLTKILRAPDVLRLSHDDNRVTKGQARLAIINSIEKLLVSAIQFHDKDAKFVDIIEKSGWLKLKLEIEKMPDNKEKCSKITPTFPAPPTREQMLENRRNRTSNAGPLTAFSSSRRQPTTAATPNTQTNDAPAATAMTRA